VNVLLAARTNWGKSYSAQAYAERNAYAVDRVVVVDYKDEFGGLVEYGLLERLTVPGGATSLERDDWAQVLRDNGNLQLARTGATDEEWRETIAIFLGALAERDERVFVLLDEAHRFAPQKKPYPDAFDTLSTTWHGEGMIVAWVTQRLAKLDTDIATQSQATLLGGFRDADLNKVAQTVEYPREVHKADAERVDDKTLPAELLVDGEPLTLRRFADDEGNTIGSEWVYSDDTTLRRENSQHWPMESTHYGSDRIRVAHPFDDD
jgi:hypothetical protein